jgi:site-specific recombinase XerC
MNSSEAKSLFLAQQNSEDTRATYARGLAVFEAFVNKPYEDVTDADVIAWKSALDGAPSTQLTRWAAVRSFYEWLVKSGRVSRSPFAAVKGPKVTKNRTPRIPDDVQFERIVSWDEAECESPRDWRDRAMIRLLGNGLRVSEVVGMDRLDFYRDDRESVYVARVTGKGDKERLVPLSNTAAMAVIDWLIHREDNPEGDFPLFVDTVFGGRVTRRQVQAAVERRRTQVGVGKSVSAHSLRHHYATRLIRAGASAFSVQRLLGHESIATTQVYVNLDISDTVRAARLDPVT